MKRPKILIIFSLLLIVLAILVYISVNTIGTISSEYALENPSTCIDCHGKMAGLSPLHAQLECISCHKGNNQLSDKDSSHFNMVRIPGNLADAEQTCGICHLEAVQKIKQSLMNSNSGIIATDKYVFGEFSTPNQLTSVDDIAHTAADEHLRSLCLRCHLGSEKDEYGPITSLSRGGGCNACHLNYTDEASQQLADYAKKGSLPSVHPSTDLKISDDHCFGCHSRSGRISTNYQGYHETLLKPNEVSNWSNYRELEDGRVFEYIEQDIHHQRGLACIDCHGFDDVMGDGELYRHEEEAVKIGCEDCHRKEHDNTIALTALPFIQQRIFTIREFAHQEKPILITAKDSAAIINGYIDTDGKARLVSKLTGQLYELKAPSNSCTRSFGHSDLSCTSCHTNWAPQCLGCHVTYEGEAEGYDLLDKQAMQGTWVEYAGSFLSGPPTLGVRESADGKSVTPAIPGMIMKLNLDSFGGDKKSADTLFHRLFAPASPHTIGAKGRSCTACHNDPLALGYGRGKLSFKADKRRWIFEPEYANSASDGLPADAWTGFLQERKGIKSTRLDFRPFTLAEQQRVLTVGACLTCHKDDSKVMINSLGTDFTNYKSTMTSQCIEPIF